MLSADDVARLVEAEIESVVAARLEPGDIGENEAANRIAETLLGPHLTRSEPFTGRVNLFSAAHGLVVFERAGIDALNRVDEAVTVATLAPFSVVRPRQMVATIKIIPFAVAGETVVRCLDLVAWHRPLIAVSPFRGLRAGLIQTTLPGTKESMLDGTTAVTRARLDEMEGSLAAERRCGHDEAAIAGALEDLLDENCDVILVFGASATVDRRDVAPAGIVRAGGQVVHFGMPVDPGNLILLAERQGVPVVVMPGCARSPKENGFDWVLQRLAVGLDVSRDGIMAMGARGLLKEITARPQPRGRRPGEVEEPAPGTLGPRIAALILAAGRSRRMGAVNKLLADVGGEPMIARVADSVLATDARPAIVVTGHEADRVQAALAGRDVAFVNNPDFRAGLSTSLRRAVEAVESLSEPVDGAIVCLGDMPLVAPSQLERLIAAFDPTDGRVICVPTYRGKQGNPILWSREFFGEMKEVTGDVGAKHLLGEHADKVSEVAMDTDDVLADIDTPDALTALSSKAG